jgi:phage terminase small subunit
MVNKFPRIVSDHVEPPPSLDEPGRNFWRRIMSEFVIDDTAGRALLEQACAGLDRAEKLAEVIRQDGEVVRTRTGVRAHPAIREELSARSFVVRTIQRLGLTLEPLRASPGRPPGGGA